MSGESALERIFVKTAPWLIGFASILLLFTIFTLGDTSKRVDETAAYTRATNCIVAKSSNPEFTQDEIERCYIQVEKNTGISLERFDEQIHNEN